MRENERERTGESCKACIQGLEFDKVVKVELQIWFLSSQKPRRVEKCNQYHGLLFFLRKRGVNFSKGKRFYSGTQN